MIAFPSIVSALGDTTTLLNMVHPARARIGLWAGFALVGAVLLLVPGPARGQASDAERCASITGNPDLAIQHCTRAIESGRLAGAELAQMHFNRATEWTAKGDPKRAIADYDAAIRLNPKYADAWFNRGHVWASIGDADRAIADFDMVLKLNPKEPGAHASRAVEWMVKGDYARAIADYETALKLEPKSTSALFGRGRAYFYSGEFRRAVPDMEQALKVEPNPYTAMWLYLARKRADAVDAEERLDEESRPFRDGAWPTAAVILFLGRTDVASVQAAATSADSRRQAEQRCEANFYVAHWHLLRGERDPALALLKQAQAGCPRDFLEHEGAVAELRRLAR